MWRKVSILGIVVAAIVIGVPAQASDVFAAFLRQYGNLQKLAEELALDFKGAQVCKTKDKLSKSDADTIATAIHKADAAALIAGTRSALAIVEVLAPRPGSPECKQIEEAVIRNNVGWRRLAANIRELP